MRVQIQAPILRGMAVGLLIVGVLITVSSAGADDSETCTNSSGDDAIAACTRAIESARDATQDVASLYMNRGHQYAYKRQYDRAIQDFDQAIRLDSQNVPAFIGRGRAYGDKGQHDRALLDYDQAIRLDTQFGRGARTDPVDIGAGQFMCCRAVLFDCRVRATWGLRDNLRGNADLDQCFNACVRNLKC